MRRDDILAILNGRSGEIRRHGVRSLSLFGSVARDEAGPTSDVDLLVEFDGAATFDRYMDLKLFLEDILNARIDLVTAKALKSRARPSVDREAIRVA